MTDATKATVLLGALALAVVVVGGFGVYQARAKAAALHQAAISEGEAHAAQQAETQAKSERAAAQQLADQALAEVARLKAQAALHPTPPAAQPVPPDASADLVLAGLRDLGLRPGLLVAPAAPDFALGLTLPDSRTTLQWGREAQRVPPLAARLEALEALTQAQEGATSALLQRAEAADQATAAADARADAQAKRAANLQRAIDLTPRWRPSSVGVIYSVDMAGQRHLGAIVTHSWGPVELGALALNNQAGAFAAYRF